MLLNALFLDLCSSYSLQQLMTHDSCQYNTPAAHGEWPLPVQRPVDPGDRPSSVLWKPLQDHAGRRPSPSNLILGSTFWRSRRRNMDWYGFGHMGVASVQSKGWQHQCRDRSPAHARPPAPVRRRPSVTVSWISLMGMVAWPTKANQKNTCKLKDDKLN